MKSPRVFSRKLDLRSRKAMVEYLTNHYRYDTMNSWNGATSYANNVKLHRLVDVDFSKALDIIDTQGWRNRVDEVIDDFNRRHKWTYQLGFNGRSGGYLVLYQGGLEPSGYKSYCTACGQQNYQPATESNKRCGACRQNARVNYQTTHLRVFSWPGKGIDQDEDFQDWDLQDLGSRCKVVMDLDRTCDKLLGMLQWACQNALVVDKVVYRPETVKVLKCA